MDKKKINISTIVNSGTGYEHDNTGDAYVGRTTAMHNPLFNAHTTVEYLNRNISVGQFLLVSFFYCGLCMARNKPNKFVRLHNHYLSLTMFQLLKVIY